MGLFKSRDSQCGTRVMFCSQIIFWKPGRDQWSMWCPGGQTHQHQIQVICLLSEATWQPSFISRRQISSSAVNFNTDPFCWNGDEAILYNGQQLFTVWVTSCASFKTNVLSFSQHWILAVKQRDHSKLAMCCRIVYVLLSFLYQIQKGFSYVVCKLSLDDLVPDSGWFSAYMNNTFSMTFFKL